MSVPPDEMPSSPEEWDEYFDEVEDDLPEFDDPANRLHFDDLHPLIRDAARESWDRRDYPNAINDAWLALRDEIRTRARKTHLDGVELINEGIGETEPKLPLTDHVTDTDRNMHRGLVNFLRGIVFFVRHPEAHESVSPVAEDRVGALERLAVMSLCARAVVVAAPPTALEDAVNELRRFLQHVGADRLYAAFLLGASTGMRRGEVLGLRWRDLDLENGRLSVSQTLVGEGQLSSPKTEKGRRSVALDSGTVEALRVHRRQQAEERLAFGPDYRDSGLVFCREDGAPLSPNAFSQTFDRLVRSAGLPRIRLHDLRHTHATLALQAGVHPKVVSERLGHSTVSITLDIYSHAIPALQESAAELVAALVLSAPPAGSP